MRGAHPLAAEGAREPSRGKDPKNTAPPASRQAGAPVGEPVCPGVPRRRDRRAAARGHHVTADPRSVLRVPHAEPECRGNTLRTPRLPGVVSPRSLRPPTKNGVAKKKKFWSAVRQGSDRTPCPLPATQISGEGKGRPASEFSGVENEKALQSRALHKQAWVSLGPG